MPIVIDGNNLLHRLRGPERSRDGVRRVALDRARHERQRVFLVFDGPPPGGSPEREELGPLTVIYAGSVSADDRIVAVIQGGGWVVVTDDRALATRARHAGAEVRPLAAWTQSLRRARQRPGKPVAEPRLSSRDVAQWEEFFARGPDAEEG